MLSPQTLQSTAKSSWIRTSFTSITGDDGVLIVLPEKDQNINISFDHYTSLRLTCIFNKHDAIAANIESTNPAIYDQAFLD